MPRYNNTTSRTPDHFRDLATRIQKIAERYSTLAESMEAARIATLDVPAFLSFEKGLGQVVKHCNNANALFDQALIESGALRPSVAVKAATGKSKKNGVGAIVTWHTTGDSNGVENYSWSVNCVAETKRREYLWIYANSLRYKSEFQVVSTYDNDGTPHRAFTYLSFGAHPETGVLTPFEVTEHQDGY